jgi:hypothetical protein
VLEYFLREGLVADEAVHPKPLFVLDDSLLYETFLIGPSVLLAARTRPKNWSARNLGFVDPAKKTISLMISPHLLLAKPRRKNTPCSTNHNCLSRLHAHTQGMLRCTWNG